MPSWVMAARREPNKPIQISFIRPTSSRAGAQIIKRAAGQGRERREEYHSCPICNVLYESNQKLQFHYDEEHSCRDPGIVTMISHRCRHCKAFFATRAQVISHVCPAKQADRKRKEITVGGWMPVRHGPQVAPPEGWWIATDGSGQACGAGWGAVVFRWPIISEDPDFILHGPVLTAEWEHLWIGARTASNNTGELSAIAEVMMWLLDEAPDDGTTPVMIRFDSYYAANIARGMWAAKSNEELAQRTYELTQRAQERRVITWQHVYGHTGEHDNELADIAADMGAKGKASSHSRRWAAPPPAAEEDNREMDKCRKCGEIVPATEIKTHVRMCKATGWAIPFGFDECRKCKELIKRTMGTQTRWAHESVCRGSSLANRTCSKCGLVFPQETEYPIGLPRAMRNHEIRCDGSEPAEEGYVKCRKCGQMIEKTLGHKTRWTHESVCRGSALSNPTCLKCGEVFPEEEKVMVGLHSGMRVHEKKCSGPGSIQRRGTTQKKTASEMHRQSGKTARVRLKIRKDIKRGATGMRVRGSKVMKKPSRR